jgi:hypothetical protein
VTGDWGTGNWTGRSRYSSSGDGDASILVKDSVENEENGDNCPFVKGDPTGVLIAGGAEGWATLAALARAWRLLNKRGLGGGVVTGGRLVNVAGRKRPSRGRESAS